MEEDQENYMSMVDWQLYDSTPGILTEKPADSNNDGDFETPTETDLPPQASLIPVTASLDSLGHPTLSFPSPEAGEFSEPQCGPATFDHTYLNVSDRVESYETANAAQIDNWNGNESLGTDGYIRLDSHGPTETAGSLQLAQPPRLVEDESFYLFDSNSDSTIVPYATSDLHNLQETTNNVSSIQAPIPSESDLFGAIDLDLGPSMVFPEMASTSFEQPALLVDNTMIAPTAPSESASSATPSDPAIFQCARGVTSRPDTFTSPSGRTNRAFSIPTEQSQPTSGGSLSHRRHYVEIRPKENAKTQNAQFSSTKQPQDSSTVIHPSSELVLATSATPSSVKGKRKRSEGLTHSQSGIPEAFTCVFQATDSNAATKRGEQRSPTRKRIRSGKACLRCQMQNLRVRRLFYIDGTSLG